MKVWVLEAGVDHEGCSAIGVYSSLELAEAAIRAAKYHVEQRGNYRYEAFGTVDSWHIKAFDTDAPATEHYPDEALYVRNATTFYGKDAT